MRAIVTYALSLAMGIVVAFGISKLVGLMFPAATDFVFWIMCIGWLWGGIDTRWRLFGTKRLMSRWPRMVPIISGLSHLAIAICILVLWFPPHGSFLYWVRGAIWGIAVYCTLWDLKIALFASSDQIRHLVEGDSNLHGRFAPSLFKDRFTQIVIALLAIVCVVILTTLG